MTFLAWLNDLLGGTDRAGLHTPPAPPVIPTPPPESSCFIKGIARSIVEEDQKAWKETDPMTVSRVDWSPPPLLDITHVRGVRVIAFPLKRGSMEIATVMVRHAADWWKASLNEAEQMLLKVAIYRCPRGQYAWKLAERQRQRKSIEAAETHFNKLGCPAP